MVKAIIRTLEKGFDIHDKSFTNTRLNEATLISEDFINSKFLKRVTLRGGETGTEGTKDIIELFSQLDSISLNSYKLGDLQTPTWLENGWRMSRTSTTYNSAKVGPGPLRTIFLHYRLGRLSIAGGGVPLSHMRGWAWSILEIVKNRDSVIKQSDLKNIIKNTGYEANKNANKLPKGTFRNAMNELVSNIAEMESHPNPTDKLSLQSNIVWDLCYDNEYVNPALIQWDCDKCDSIFSFSCPNCNKFLFYRPPQKDAKLTCKNCGYEVINFHRVVEEQFCPGCGQPGDPPELEKCLTLTFTPKGNTVISRQLTLISKDVENVSPYKNDIFHIDNGELIRRSPTCSPTIELKDISEFSDLLSLENLPTCRKKDLKEFARQRMELCKAVQNRKKDKYMPCYTCLTDIPNKDDPLSLLINFNSNEKRTFSGSLFK